MGMWSIWMFSIFLQVIHFYKQSPANIMNRNIDAAGREYLEIIHGYRQKLALLVSYHDSNSCSKCKRNTPDRELEQCAGCSVARYCSKKCQVKDWKRGHRDDCAEIRKARSVLYDYLPGDGHTGKKLAATISSLFARANERIADDKRNHIGPDAKVLLAFASLEDDILKPYPEAWSEY